MNNKIAFLDIEVEKNDKIADLGAIKDEQFIHTKSIDDFVYFVSDCDFLCGHNIISHDLKYLSYRLNSKEYKILDTLYLSPLLFPERPYHALLKDDILQNDQLNNPVNDSQKAKELFFDEVNAFKLLNIRRQRIYKTLLKDTEQFRDFFSYIECDNSINLIKDIQEEFKKVEN